MVIWSIWEEISRVMAILCLVTAGAAFVAAGILLVREELTGRLLETLKTETGRRKGILVLAAAGVWILVIGHGVSAAEVPQAERMASTAAGSLAGISATAGSESGTSAAGSEAETAAGETKAGAAGAKAQADAGEAEAGAAGAAAQADAGEVEAGAAGVTAPDAASAAAETTAATMLILPIPLRANCMCPYLAPADDMRTLAGSNATTGVASPPILMLQSSRKFIALSPHVSALRVFLNFARRSAPAGFFSHLSQTLPSGEISSAVTCSPGCGESSTTTSSAPAGALKYMSRFCTTNNGTRAVASIP